PGAAGRARPAPGPNNKTTARNAPRNPNVIVLPAVSGDGVRPGRRVTTRAEGTPAWVSPKAAPSPPVPGHGEGAKAGLPGAPGSRLAQRDGLLVGSSAVADGGRVRTSLPAARSSPPFQGPTTLGRLVSSLARPQVRRGYPLSLSISISGGKETNKDSPSNGERTGK
ncbi:hypothetical protein PIB30_113199, partial [Stylosanthes scabra]|nr:hypothetical protein [Stylosanthes scabra]